MFLLMVTCCRQSVRLLSPDKGYPYLEKINLPSHPSFFEIVMSLITFLLHPTVPSCSLQYMYFIVGISTTIGKKIKCGYAH